MILNEGSKKFDFNLAFTVLALTLISLINLFSATHTLEFTSLSSMFIAQMVWLSLGWIVYLVVSFLNLRLIKQLTWLIYGVNLVFLASVKYLGKSFYGAQRWLDFGIFRYQPSETMKVALVLVLGISLAKFMLKDSLKLKDLIFPLILTVVPFMFTVIQPDLGTALILLIIFGTMVLFIGIDRRLLGSLTLLAVMCFPLVWAYGLKTYQKQRILTFLNPSSDIRGGGYNSRQSKIAVGSGLLLGRGYRKGTQSQLQFLPERHTDFIFSVLSEEHGFVGSVLTVFIFLLLFLNIINIAQVSPDPFGTLSCIGIGAILFWHFFINIGMITGILPVVGVPLPLLSYGGSSILTTMGALGLVSNISRHRHLFK